MQTGGDDAMNSDYHREDMTTRRSRSDERRRRDERLIPPRRSEAAATIRESNELRCDGRKMGFEKGRRLKTEEKAWFFLSLLKPKIRRVALYGIFSKTGQSRFGLIVRFPTGSTVLTVFIQRFQRASRTELGTGSRLNRSN
ncbi:hypothetical protein PIB30_045874 [Stylosanthes scabra]|uniref:Uncharacterized protein n=1 Tax=Stylosanthes scabra TaxID=79078 RepID=A0ABU6RGB1_9FABA|nr:hypothetical protein [Stylosanthes scabra]